MNTSKYLLFLALVAVSLCHKSHNPLVELRPLLQGDRVPHVDQVQLIATPDILNKNGDVATVRLSGVKNPLETDIIAVYQPADADLTLTSPIKFLPGSLFGSNYLKTGSAIVQLDIVNMHTDVAFIFFKNASTNENIWRDSHLKVGGRSNTITFSNIHHPNQGHLAFTKTAGEVKLMWASGYKQSVQQWAIGKTSNHYDMFVSAHTYTYKASDLCDAPATTWGWKNPGFLHEAVAVLEPGVSYFYIYGSNSTGWSDESSFTAPVPPGTDSLQFVAIGDLGKYQSDKSSEHWGEDNAPYLTTQGILKTVKNGDASMVLHVGDIAYAVGYSAQWDEFLDQIRPVSERVPWMTLPGNHERDWTNGASLNLTDSLGECGVPYEHRFRMPTTGVDKPWYSFETGPVHFLTMSTEHSFDAKSEQFKFIAKDLASVDRQKTPWLVLAGHRPMYIDSTNYEPDGGDQTIAKALRDALEPLIVKHKVDVCFWGHHHSYQRTCPVNNEKCVADGQAPIHFDVGNAGFGMSTNILKQKPDWTLFVDAEEHGFSTVVVDRKNFKLTYHGNQSGIKDRLHLTKP